MKKIKLGKKQKIRRGLWLPLLLFAAVFAVVLTGLSGSSKNIGNEGQRLAESAIKRAVVSCYALEGCYPESYEYLRDNYGLSINQERYTIHYTVFASNIMPDVRVIQRGLEK